MLLIRVYKKKSCLLSNHYSLFYWDHYTHNLLFHRWLWVGPVISPGSMLRKPTLAVSSAAASLRPSCPCLPRTIGPSSLHVWALASSSRPTSPVLPSYWWSWYHWIDSPLHTASRYWLKALEIWWDHHWLVIYGHILNGCIFVWRTCDYKIRFFRKMSFFLCYVFMSQF